MSFLLQGSCHFQKSDCDHHCKSHTTHLASVVFLLPVIMGCNGFRGPGLPPTDLDLEMIPVQVQAKFHLHLRNRRRKDKRRSGDWERQMMTTTTSLTMNYRIQTVHRPRRGHHVARTCLKDVPVGRTQRSFLRAGLRQSMGVGRGMASQPSVARLTTLLARTPLHHLLPTRRSAVGTVVDLIIQMTVPSQWIKHVQMRLIFVTFCHAMQQDVVVPSYL